MANSKKRLAGMLATGLVTIMFLLAFFSSSGIWQKDNPGHSGIVDEIAHIPAGYAYLQYQDYRLNPEHPPLVKDLAALPLQFMSLNFPTDIAAWNDETNGQWESGWKFIYERGNNPESIFFWARLLPMLLIFLLGYYVYRWAHELFGRKAALVALLLLAFAPNFLTHATYVTTDFGVAVFIFIAVYYFTKFIREPSYGKITAVSITLALAALAKFSAFLLFPYFALLILIAILVRQVPIKDFFSRIAWKSEKKKRWFVYVISGVIILIVSHLIIAVPYTHHITKMPATLETQLINDSLPQTTGISAVARNALHSIEKLPGGRPFAQYFLGVSMVFARVSGGNSAFLVGDYRNEGWWYYYFVAYALKNPLPIVLGTIMLMVFGVWNVFRKSIPLSPFLYQGRGNQAQNASPLLDKEGGRGGKICRWTWARFEIISMLGVIAMFWLAGIKSTANIGIRWMIPNDPFTYVLLGGMVMWMLRHGGQRRLKQIIFGALGAWLVIGTLSWYPIFPSYFNELIGSRNNAYKYLVDSNLDWGQDLNRLGNWVKDQNLEKIYVDYFGGGVPEHSITTAEVIPWHSRYGLPEEGSYLAVSATFYQMSEYFARVNGEVSYVRILSRAPDFQVGHSILVYHITADDLAQFVTSERAEYLARVAIADYLRNDVGVLGEEIDIDTISAEETVSDAATRTVAFPIRVNQRPAWKVVVEAEKRVFAVYIDRLNEEVLGY